MSKRLFRAGEYYHVYNRGNVRQPIFFEPENYRFFLTRLRQYFTADTADIIAYCLMPNHYHLMLYLWQDDLSALMHSLGMGYAKAVNARYQRVAHLFQGPFRAKRIETTAQLAHLSRYIHLNPVRAGLVQRPEDWEYSSYLEFTGARNGTLPRPKAVLELFAGPQAYAAFVKAYRTEDRKWIEALLFG